MRSLKAALCRTCVATFALAIAIPAAASAAPAPEGIQYRVLVFTKATAEKHASTSAGVSAVRALGIERRFSVEVSDDAKRFEPKQLAKYRAVVFLNTSGDVLTDAQQAAFEAYFRDGGGLVGVHSAIETEPGWEFLTDALGARATGSSAVTSATVKVADRVHVASESLPEYWTRTDQWYNFDRNVRGFSHVLATVDETTYSGGTMHPDHPVAWCKDYQGGRSFYIAGGHTSASFSEPGFRRHLGGAIQWAAGVADPVYSDCGATVLANYKQIKVSGPPNLNEPIGFDQLPDGRVIQTARAGQVRLHDPAGGTTTTLATIPVYTNSEDGLYGPAVDRDFATNKWVYLYYAPPTVTNVKQSDGTIAPSLTTPPTATAPTTNASLAAWDPFVGYFQLSRFKFVDATPGNPAHLDLGSEQQILRVSNNRGACCHVAGDIDFDKHNNLWLVTGDDTPSGGGNSGGFSPHNDQKTDEFQTVRVNGATGGTFTLTFDGQTTAPIPFNATAAQVQTALEGLSNVDPGDAVVNGNQQPNQTQTVSFDGQYAQDDVPQMTRVSALTGPAPDVVIATTQQGNWFYAPYVDARRSAGNTNDLRGKVLRIKVGADGSYTTPAGNLFAPGQAGTRPEIYAMGFRNPFRIQVDDNDVAYVSDYSPDSQVPQQFRGPAGTGRFEVVPRPANYGWPLCVTPSVPYYRWNFNTTRPLDATPTPYECGNPAKGAPNDSRWNTRADGFVDATAEPGLTETPPITQPDVWYSYRDNQNPALGTPCFAAYGPDPLGTCPQLFPELFTGGVGPHGTAPYDFDPANPSETKFPPYYDGSWIGGEFTQDTMREFKTDSQGRILKINQFLNCGAALIPTMFSFECDNPMDMQFGADGNFYLLTYGDGFFNANADAGMYRWEYKKGPEAPHAVVKATPTNGATPLTVAFSSDGSGDDDEGDSITFAWDFDNNGTVDSIDPDPSHTYTASGVYTARLTVTDSTGKTDSASTVITVGNTAPTVTITTPVDGDFFDWGQNIPYSVTVTDPEDASIDCSRVTVTFVLVHDTHGHAEESKTGCSGVLSTDAADASHGGYVAGGISASYTDTGPNPLTTVSQNIVQIKRQEVEFAQDQSGTTLGNVGTNDVGGGQNRTSLDPGDWIALNNRFDLANMDQQISFRFAANAPAGTDRAAVEVHLDAVDGPLAGMLTLKATGSANVYTTQTLTFSPAISGSHRLYLVFRTVPGGAATGFGNLNWVGFTGPGAGVNP